jgi:hypothetical protein
MTKDEALASVLAQSEGQHLGDLCGWSLSGVIRQDEARMAADELGLYDDFGFPKLSPNSAYRRAVALAVKSGRRDEERYEAVKVEDNTDRIVHSIIRKDIVAKYNGSMSEKDAEFSTETQIGFDKKHYNLGSDKPHVIFDRVKANFEELCIVYKPDDIRTAFQRAFEKWGGIRMLDHGGLWWVPAPYADRVRLWKEFMEKTLNTTLILPVFDTSETIAGLRRITQESVDGQLHDLIEELQSFVTKGDGIRQSTLEKRVKKFDDIRDKADLYERLLGHRMTELKDSLKQAQQGLMQTIKMVGAQ